MPRGVLWTLFAAVLLLTPWASSWSLRRSGAVASPLHYSFLPKKYQDASNSSQQFYIRQVPGDGGCLFHSFSCIIAFKRSRTHIPQNSRLLQLSNSLRSLAVASLRSNTTLLLGSGESMASADLLEVTAAHYNTTVADYCGNMSSNSSAWGGGPEIVALANHFRCPVHIYQLQEHGLPWLNRHFRLKVQTRIGSPEFDRKAPIHILYTDGRFPHVSPGKQKDVGDHFMAMFPAEVVDQANSSHNLHYCASFGTCPQEPKYFLRGGG